MARLACVLHIALPLCERLRKRFCRDTCAIRTFHTYDGRHDYADVSHLPHDFPPGTWRDSLPRLLHLDERMRCSVNT